MEADDTRDRELAAARRTIDALVGRVEALEDGSTGESGALARALAGVQHELSRRTRSLEQSEASWRALYESSPDPLLTVDGDGTVIACNRTALVSIGGAVEDVVGRALVRWFEPEDAVRVDRLVASRWAGVSEHRLKWRDGRRVSLNAAAIDATGTRWYLTLRDQTNRDVLDQADDQRRRMDALAELASAIARELNDPMSIVQGRLELLLELGESDPAAWDKHLRIALEHARRVSATLHNLRLVGRGGSPELQPVFVSEALDEALELVGPRVKSVDLRLDVDPPDLAAGADPPMAARVIANLLTCALDGAGRSGRIELRARKAKDEVVVTVTGGTGPALGPRDAESADASAASTTGGIGLSIARTLLQSIGGRVDARKVGGSLVLSAAMPLPPHRRARALPVEERLLAVGRDEHARALAAAVRKDGFDVVHARDAAAALAAIEADDGFAGVVTELFLEGMSGLGLADEIARRAPHLRGRVLLVTDARIEAVASTAVPLSPPLRRADVLAALGRKVRRRR